MGQELSRTDACSAPSGLAVSTGAASAGAPTAIQSASSTGMISAASRVGLHAALIIPVLLALWIAIGAQALAAPVETARPEGAEHASVRDNS